MGTNHMDVELEIYSGRPNPTIKLSTADILAFKSILSTLKLQDYSLPNNRSLGYRGFLVMGKKEVYEVYRDSVSSEFNGVLTQYSDKNMSIEKFLYSLFGIQHEIPETLGFSISRCWR